MKWNKYKKSIGSNKKSFETFRSREFKTFLFWHGIRLILLVFSLSHKIQF